MTHPITQLRLMLDPDPDRDPEEAEQLTRQLRAELLELDVPAVEWMTGGPAPAQAKGGEVFTWGTLLLTLAASGGVLTTLIGVVQAWLTRQGQRSATLEINGDKLQLTGISSAEQQQLIAGWLRRHSA